MSSMSRASRSPSSYRGDSKSNMVCRWGLFVIFLFSYEVELVLASSTLPRLVESIVRYHLVGKQLLIDKDPLPLVLSHQAVSHRLADVLSEQGIVIVATTGDIRTEWVQVGVNWLVFHRDEQDWFQV